MCTCLCVCLCVRVVRVYTDRQLGLGVEGRLQREGGPLIGSTAEIASVASDRSFSIVGIKNARVLPVPVLAFDKTSLPLLMIGSVSF